MTFYQANFASLILLTAILVSCWYSTVLENTLKCLDSFHLLHAHVKDTAQNSHRYPALIKSAKFYVNNAMGH